MDIPTALIAPLILIQIGIAVYSVWLVRKLCIEIRQYNTLLSKQMLDLHKRIDNIFVVDQPAPNSMVNKDANKIDVHDINPNYLPKDIKFQVEGGDVFTPPEFIS
jgi:hypothetical protein